MSDALAALEAVMGDPFAHLKLGSGTYRDPDAAMRLARAMARRRPDARGYAAAASGVPEAMVKIVRGGGAKSRSELANQLAYLSRQGDLPIEASPLYGEGRLEKDELADVLETWADGFHGASKWGHTLHLIVSYPEGTPQEAAYNAGRAFAEAAFDSGEHGDRWEYLTAFHTDRAHPHLHVIVNRRGIEEGLWLSTYRYDALNLDALRSLQARTALGYGIDLNVTPRLARGARTRPADDVERRRAAREGRAVRQRDWSPVERRAAGLVADRHASAYSDLGAAFRNLGSDHGARTLTRAAADILAGREIMGEGGRIPKDETERLEALKTSIAASLARAETAIASIGDVSLRAQREAELGRLKGGAAGLFPERDDFAAHKIPAPAGLYRPAGSDGMDLPNDVDRADPLLDRVATEIRSQAEAIGVDGAALLARYGTGGPLDAGTAALWIDREMGQALANRGVSPKTATAEDRDAARVAVDGLHRAASAGLAESYRQARGGEGRGVEHRSDRQAQAIREDDGQGERMGTLEVLARRAEAALARPEKSTETREDQRRFLARIDAEIGEDGARRLMVGDSGAIARLASGEPGRMALAALYVRASADLAEDEAARRAWLRAAVALARRDRAQDHGRVRDEGGLER